MTSTEPDPIVVVPEQSATAVSAPAPVAPLWHTLLLVSVMLLFSAGSANSDHSLAVRYGKHWQYIATILWEWILFGFVWWGIYRRSVRMRDLVGGRWRRVEDALIDVSIAAGFWLVAIIALSAIGYAMGLTGAARLDDVRRQLGFLVPRSNLELVLWFALSITAGICEEVVFRGYLQRQFGAWTRNAWLGIALSAIIFGAGHGYQGPKRMFLIAIYGCMFGVLAHLRRTLRPGMIAHGFHDIFTGLVLRFLLK